MRPERVKLAEAVVLSGDDIRRTLVRIAHEIVESNQNEAVALVGIHTRGAYIANRLKALVSEFSGHEVMLGDLDISFYRDDLSRRGPEPIVNSTSIEFSPDDMTVVLVDDVLFTGRTARAAMDALFDYGRPSRLQIAVLIDRGHHELPIRPDYVGKNIPTAKDDRVYVKVSEHDSEDEVTVVGQGDNNQNGGSKSQTEDKNKEAES